MVAVYGQIPVINDSKFFRQEKIVLYFRVNKAIIEEDYMTNAWSLRKMDELVSTMNINNTIENITVSGFASPEGSEFENNMLAANRVDAVKAYLMKKNPHISSDQIIIDYTGENWDGLYEMVESDKYVPMRSQILDIIRSKSDSYSKKAGLKRLGGGEPYKYIKQYILPYVRIGSSIVVNYKYKRESYRSEKDTVYVRDTVFLTDFNPEEQLEVTENKRHPYMALKNNLLYDVALLPNLAVEIPLGKKWSIQIESDWSWWNANDERRWFHRIQVAGIEIRKWFGRTSQAPLTGYYMGIYGMGGAYDFKFSTTGYLSNWSHSAGVSYGYSLSVSKNLNMEFGVSIGYLKGKYHDYIYDKKFDDYDWQQTRERNYFGPTKAGITIAWLIGNKTKK